MRKGSLPVFPHSDASGARTLARIAAHIRALCSCVYAKLVLGRLSREPSVSLSATIMYMGE